MFRIKNTNLAIENLEKLYQTLEKALVIYKDGIKNYLYSNKAGFNSNLNTISQLETESRIIRREIENNLYNQPALVRFRGDFMQLVAQLNKAVDVLNDTLFQFEIEVPYIPAELSNEYMKLAEHSAQALECVISATKAYFQSSETIMDRINRIYFFERESYKQAQAIKRKVFHNMNSLKMSEKFHLRYFASSIESVVSVAEIIADQLSVMSIKRTL